MEHVEGADGAAETYNPWSVVHLVFTHLASEGLHPVLGETGDPAVPARDLLASLGITPSAEGDSRVMAGVRAQLDELRITVFEQEG